jgi:hypothetical protein
MKYSPGDHPIQHHALRKWSDHHGQRRDSRTDEGLNGSQTAVDSPTNLLWVSRFASEAMYSREQMNIACHIGWCAGSINLSANRDDRPRRCDREATESRSQILVKWGMAPRESPTVIYRPKTEVKRCPLLRIILKYAKNWSNFQIFTRTIGRNFRKQPAGCGSPYKAQIRDVWDIVRNMSFSNASIDTINITLWIPK